MGRGNDDVKNRAGDIADKLLKDSKRPTAHPRMERSKDGRADSCWEIPPRVRPKIKQS